METQVRRCVGSARYGIAAHDAPITDLPVQASGREGLGRMCRDHWRRYTAGLRQDATARSGAPAAITEPIDAGTERAPRVERPARTTRPARATVTRPVPERVRRARAVVDAVEHLSGEAYTDAVASDEVQAALEVSAAASVGRTVEAQVDEPAAA